MSESPRKSRYVREGRKPTSPKPSVASSSDAVRSDELSSSNDADTTDSAVVTDPQAKSPDTAKDLKAQSTAEIASTDEKSDKKRASRESQDEPREQRRSRRRRSRSRSEGRSGRSEPVDSSRSSSREREPKFGILPAIGAAIVCAMIVIAPWWLASVTAGAQYILALGALAAIGIWWLSFAVQGMRVARLPSSFVLVAAFAAIPGLQLMPLSADWLAKVSPYSIELREMSGWYEITDARNSATSGRENATAAKSTDTADSTGEEDTSQVSESVAAANQKQAISVDPRSTKRFLLIGLLGVTGFCTGAVFFRRRSALKWLLGVVIVNGILLSLLGLIHQAIGEPRQILWLMDVEQGHPFASFVNPNNAAGFLNLCLACAAGAIFWAFGTPTQDLDEVVWSDSSKKRGSLQSTGVDWESIDPDSARDETREFSKLVAGINVPKLIALGAGGILLAGVMGTLSRGGMIAACVSFAVIGIAMFCKPRFRALSILVAVVLFFSVITVGTVGVMQSVNQEIQTVADVDVETDTRTNVALDTLPHWKNHLFFGTGLGSFQHVFRIYQSEETGQIWAHHADNTFVEVFVDFGGIGFVIMLLLIVWTTWNAIQLLRKASEASDFAVGLIGLFAVTSQIVQGFVDYGLYMPPNLLLMGLIAGLTSGYAYRLSLTGQGTRLFTWSLPSVVAWTVPLVLFAALMLLLRPTKLEWESEAAISQAATTINGLTDLKQEEDYLLSESASQRLENARNRLVSILQRNPTEPGYRALGDLYVVEYRRVMAARLEDNAIARKQELSFSERYQASGLSILHDRVHTEALDDNDQMVDVIRQDPPVQEFLVPARNAYLNAIACCPLVAVDQLRVAELTFIVASPETEQVWLDRAARLAPNRSDLIAQIGLLEAQAGRTDLAEEHLLQVLKSNARLGKNIILGVILLPLDHDRLVDALDVEPLELYALAKDIGTRGVVGEMPRAIHVRNRLLDRALEAWLEIHESNTRDLTFEELDNAASVLVERDQKELATEFREKAVEVQPYEFANRIELANLYLEQERAREALEQVEFCFDNDEKKKQDSYRKLKEKIIESNPNSVL